jgi:hypothetical protein
MEILHRGQLLREVLKLNAKDSMLRESYFTWKSCRFWLWQWESAGLLKVSGSATTYTQKTKLTPTQRHIIPMWTHRWSKANVITSNSPTYYHGTHHNGADATTQSHQYNPSLDNFNLAKQPHETYIQITIESSHLIKAILACTTLGDCSPTRSCCCCASPHRSICVGTIAV